MHSANSKMLKLIKILILWLKSMDVWFGPHATTASPAFFTPQTKGLLVRVAKSKPPSHGRSSGQICEALYETYLGGGGIEGQRSVRRRRCGAVGVAGSMPCGQ